MPGEFYGGAYVYPLCSFLRSSSMRCCILSLPRPRATPALLSKAQREILAHSNQSESYVQ